MAETRSTNGQASFHLALGSKTGREEMQSEGGRGTLLLAVRLPLSLPLAPGLFVSHWKNDLLGEKGEVLAERKNKLSRKRFSPNSM
ncbi:hypothetical protein TNCV_33421 [Trichonephila clavipes]|nr:hypothetical protein TNCV_33421 [Trichonephila clavipes]